MTFERKIVVSLDEIDTLVLQCNTCGAKIAAKPQEWSMPPQKCPAGHAWNWNVAQEEREILAPAAAWLMSLNRLTIPGTFDRYGFRISLEFKEPTLR